jgi:hypothetical protein
VYAAVRELRTAKMCGGNNPKRKWGPVSPPAPTLPLNGPAGAAPFFGDRFRPRPFGLGRFRRGFRVARGFRKFRYAVRWSEDVPFRHVSVRPKASGPASGHLRKVGSARFGFRRPALRASSLNTLPIALQLLFSVLANFKTASPRWQWLAAVDPFPVRRSSGHPCKLAGGAESSKRKHPVDKKDNGDKIRRSGSQMKGPGRNVPPGPFSSP